MSKRLENKNTTNRERGRLEENDEMSYLVDTTSGGRRAGVGGGSMLGQSVNICPFPARDPRSGRQTKPRLLDVKNFIPLHFFLPLSWRKVVCIS